MDGETEEGMSILAVPDTFESWQEKEQMPQEMQSVQHCCVCRKVRALFE